VHGHTLALNGFTLDLTPFIERDDAFDYDDFFPVAQVPLSHLITVIF